MYTHDTYSDYKNEKQNTSLRKILQQILPMIDGRWYNYNPFLFNIIVTLKQSKQVIGVYVKINNY